MKITFHGAAGSTTGSMHLLEVNGSRILLDCGLVQGRRKESFERNRNLPFDPATLDVVLLSHAHIDHSGNLPSLVKKGFRGKIIATTATRDLCDLMLRDSAYLQARDVEYVNKKRRRQGKTPFEILYGPQDVEETLSRFADPPYEESVEVASGVTATFHDAGHILGSAMITIDVDGPGGAKRLLFTGDMGRKGMPILRDPTVVHDVDWLITESTYGNRLHPPRQDIEGQLEAFVADICAQKSRLVIPSFSVGRTQIIVYFLREIYKSKRIPRVPVFVDSPLSTRASKVHMNHQECYDHEAWRVFIEGKEPFQFGDLTYITDVKDSKELNKMPGPAVIISASGMCEGGRILHHLKHCIEDPRSIILIVGYQAEHTLGRRLVEHVSPIKIFGEPYKPQARVHTINALSAHADRNEMMAYFGEMGIEKLERVFCVHGEGESLTAMTQALTDAGAKGVMAPTLGETVEV